MKRKQGFTLIELLVVIAIIAVLSTVVLGNLNVARESGANAAIRSNLSNLRDMIAVYYDTNGNYGTVSVNGCTSGGMFNATTPNDISGAITAALTASGHTSGIYCRSNVGAHTWAIAVPLKPLVTTGPQPAWCVDYRGITKQITFSMFSSSICP